MSPRVFWRRGDFMSTGLMLGRLLRLRPRHCTSIATPSRHPAWFYKRNYSDDVKEGRYVAYRSPEERNAYIDLSVRRFRQQLHSPDHVQIGATRARAEFGLTRKLLGKLTESRKHESSEELYWLKDVVSMALKISSEDMIVDRYRHYLESGRDERYRRNKIYGMNQVEKGQIQSWWSHLWFSRKDNDPQGADVVRIAIGQNSAICVVKLGVAFYTGSYAVFADAMHSVADVINALYRYVGINLATRDPDYRHPYGYERLRYVFTDRSSLVLLGVGGLYPLIHGIQALSEQQEISSPSIMGILFVIVGALETPALIRSYQSIREKAGRAHLSLLSYLRYGNDMISITTFAECTLGVLAAGAGVLATILYTQTGDGWYDAVASVFIASTVVAGSGVMLSKNSKVLVGETLPMKEVELLVFMIEGEETVASIHDVKTEVLGVDTVRFKAEIEFNAEAITRKIKNLHSIPSPESKQLLDEVSQIESEVQAEDWIMKNNALYQTALSTELQRIEHIIKQHLQEANFKNFYIDLELW
ncbi:hypothetical protein AAMO2058_001632800 [Amorphochlora amoebiformis]